MGPAVGPGGVQFSETLLRPETDADLNVWLALLGLLKLGPRPPRSTPDQSQRATMPPSTMISVPVTKRASSDARNSAALAVSRPSPMNPNGMRATRDCRSFSTSPPVRCLASRASTIGVCNWPGTTVFTRMPLLAYCTATTRDNWITPAFEAA